MRIAAISNSRIPSATANSIQAMKVCDALVQAGHEVRLIVPAETEPASWNDLARHYGITHEFRLVWLSSKRALRRIDFLWYARAAARRTGAQLIYTWLPQSAAVEAWENRPVVLEMHADVAGPLGAWWLRQFWRSRRGRLLVTTTALRRALERSTQMPFPDDAVQVAPNGVDLQRYEDLPAPAAARARLQLPEAFTIGFTGHFYAGRGIELLFELARGLPDVQFLWVGGTSEAVAEWREKLLRANQTNVTLTGFVENSGLAIYQAASDVLLMPYTTSVAASSGQDIAEVINPMKMFEYMAARRPIITSSLPVIREVLDETRAVFCPPGEVSAWKAAILELASDPARRAALADNARREVEKYTWLGRVQRALEHLDLP
ncbi:MAG: glycosyltransferase family 4 protein [Chloroflexota bacterium]